MHLAEFDYILPERNIAQEPLEDRSASRMLVVYRNEGRWEDRAFRDLPQFLHAGDCMVLNNSKVLPARLHGHRKGFEGHIEVLLVRAISEDRLTWRCLARPGRKLRTGERLWISDQLEAEIIGRGEHGERLLRFHCAGSFHDAVAAVGDHKTVPRLDAPATPERVLMAIEKIRRKT